jgi:hypothetical protein
MAASRYTTPTVFLRRNLTKSHCMTCGRERLRDGNLGALQPPQFCGQACFTRYRQFSAPRVFAATGAGYAGSVMPIAIGGVSLS